MENLGKSVALIGLGYWGQNILRNLHEFGVLHTACDSNVAVMEEHKKKFADIRYLESWEKILPDPAIRAVAIATPAVMHYACAKQCLLAGKDVFVEKPMAITVSEGEELVALAQKNNRILMVGHVLHYHPAIVKLKEIIGQGRLGKIQYVYSHRLNIGKLRIEENILWSFAPHDISILLMLLEEEPAKINAFGGDYVNQGIFDTTLTSLEFKNGVKGHIFVSWLHPYKEQKLVVVGSQAMAVFDDVSEEKLCLYPHKIEWKEGKMPVAQKAASQAIAIEKNEPLKEELRHFCACVVSRQTPKTDGVEGLRVLKVLESAQKCLIANTQSPKNEPKVVATPDPKPYFAHPSAYVDEGAQVGVGSKIWHFCHVMKGAHIGERCVLGQNVNVDSGVVMGNNVKIQNNVSVYTGVVIEDDVFLGPSCVLTNVTNPRSQVNRHSLYEKTVLKKGCTIGANATLVCGITVGRYSFIGAGAVVSKDVPDYALMLGNPARQHGWMSRHGHRLQNPDADGIMTCPESRYRYKEDRPGHLHCLDLDEEAPLPPELCKGTKSYDEFKV